MTVVLTPSQRQALSSLTPGTWRPATLAHRHGLDSLARHRPDLVEVSVRTTATGPVREYRLTEVGERVRGEMMKGTQG